MSYRLGGWQKIWLLAAVIYAVVLISLAANEHAYIYESKHYEKVISDMDEGARLFYFNQKCNNLETYPAIKEPNCFTMETIDDGTLNFDATTSRTEAENVLKAYNKAAFKYVLMASAKFMAKYLLIWGVPALLLYLLGVICQRFFNKRAPL